MGWGGPLWVWWGLGTLWGGHHWGGIYGVGGDVGDPIALLGGVGGSPLGLRDGDHFWGGSLRVGILCGGGTPREGGIYGVGGRRG